MQIDEAVAYLAACAPRLGQTRLVAVDGPGGAGKSTLAEHIAARCDAQLVHTDDFASWENQLDWWPQLERQVLEPLAHTRRARYQRYDWDSRQLAEWHAVEPGGIVVVEGVSSARAAMRDRLSLSIWVETPPDVRLTRGLRRDGPDAAGLWQRWMAAEDAHFEADRTREHADVVVRGFTE